MVLNLLSGTENQVIIARQTSPLPFLWDGLFQLGNRSQFRDRREPLVSSSSVGFAAHESR
jgi:hypothetical protein